MNSSDPQADHLFKKRHSLAHLLAMAVLEYDPTVKMAIGPVIDTGFYYDFEFSEGKIPSPENLKDFQKKMKKLASGNINFEMKEISPDDARAMFKDQPYKLELIEDLAKDGEKMTTYTSGSFTDLCAGPHVENTKEIDTDGFVVSHTAGAYWKGDEKNKMLTRIYGLAFNNKADLDAYVKQQEEAKKRDHRKLGKELKLFTISELIGPGLPLMQPKGMIIRKQIEDYLWELHKDLGYDRVWTPHIAKEALYVTSGHAEKFGDELFRVQGKEDKFIMKPMNCPHHMQIFADNQFSYRDMPVRYFEPATIYRDEKSGQLGGLTRVRAITQDDGHLFCRVNQIADEFKTIISIIHKFYKTIGMDNDYWVRLSLRGDDKSQYLGTDEVWQVSEKALTDVCIEQKLPYKEAKGEAAFYGPKLDFMFKDCIGREWQLATIQCDFNLPNRFDLSFINEKGEKERPVVIHRAISGSLERFMGVMIEHFAGAFPTWLSPVQVSVVAVAEAHHTYAEEIVAMLKKEGVRVDADYSSESMGKKIRNAKVSKTPYIFVVGDKEVEGKTVSIESRDMGDSKDEANKIAPLPVAEAIAKIKEEIATRALSTVFKK